MVTHRAKAGSACTKTSRRSINDTPAFGVKNSGQSTFPNKFGVRAHFREMASAQNSATGAAIKMQSPATRKSRPGLRMLLGSHC
jgi:hypothetical protein